ncbi:hypothetical protein FE634_04145 [Nocardioides dongxiaopingii]|uniref:hypothetical protein n=1 Tax=Nocardioides sp. S-1144 TaxID=2582905 RepID=UPI00110DC77D|nr:hypothetical protein [Nocardioides sp. S-1144]QCW49802.1 hypothetical protein FE634_04145 [Nocardioides sp. S-1144]
MAEAALGMWIVTALGGTYLFLFTTDAHRPEAGSPTTALSPFLLFVHPLVALVGIAMWIAHLQLRDDVLPWLGLADLLVGAALGEVLLARTLRGARQGPVRSEDRMPRPAIALHGVLAAVTILLVLLVALGVD